MSYSCMSNMADRIKAHNNKILNQETPQSTTDSDQEKCNCRQKEECPLNGKCLTTAIVYQATVQYDGQTAKYIGLTEGDFKTRYRNHVKSFKHIKYKTETELSKLVRSLKEKNKLFKIKWKTLTKATPYRCGSRRCGLCSLSLKKCVLHWQTILALIKEMNLFPAAGTVVSTN